MCQTVSCLVLLYRFILKNMETMLDLVCGTIWNIITKITKSLRKYIFLEKTFVPCSFQGFNAKTKKPLIADNWFCVWQTAHCLWWSVSHLWCRWLLASRPHSFCWFSQSHLTIKALSCAADESNPLQRKYFEPLQRSVADLYNLISQIVSNHE